MIEIFLALSLVLLAVSLFFNYRFAIFILRIEDTIEDCLDQLDEKYKTFSKILEKPVFFDSIEIRQVIQEIKSSQELILLIANRLSNPRGLSSDEKDTK
jgi:hypothetical protein